MKPGPKPRLTAQEKRDRHAAYMRDWRGKERKKIQALQARLAQLEQALAETETSKPKPTYRSKKK